MPTNWIVPTVTMIPRIISLQSFASANENIDTDSITAAEQNPPPSQNGQFDPTLDDRGTELINMVVAQVREAIQLAGRIPLSVTTGAVPPMAVRHVLNIVAFQLVSSKTNLPYVIMTEKGTYSPLQTLYREGLKYIEGLMNGGGCLPPSDPTGIDYVNAIDPNNNPPITAVFSLPMNGDVDTATDGNPGGKVSRGTLAPNGNMWGLIGDIYEQTNSSNQIIKIWEKVTDCGTTGWI